MGGNTETLSGLKSQTRSHSWPRSNLIHCVCVCVCVRQLATGTGDAARACETDGLHKSRVCVSDPDFLVCSDPIWAAGEWGSLPPSLPPSLVSLSHFSGMDLTNSCRPHSHSHPHPMSRPIPLHLAVR